MPSSDDSPHSTLLSTLDDKEIDALYASHRAEFAPHDLSLKKLHALVARARTHGVAMTDSLVNVGVSGVGVRFEMSPGNYGADAGLAKGVDRGTDRAGI